MKEQSQKRELTLKNDIVFKAFFGRKGNEKYLKSFLEALLNIPIVSIEITQEATELPKSKIEELKKELK